MAMESFGANYFEIIVLGRLLHREAQTRHKSFRTLFALTQHKSFRAPFSKGAGVEGQSPRFWRFF